MKPIAPRLERLESRLAPSTFTVTTLANSGVGSLRQALVDADDPVHPGPDKIVFKLPAPPLHGENTITLTTGELTSKGNVTIVGPGSGKLIVSGNGASRVFHFDDSASTDAPVTISGLSIVSGMSAGKGGGILSNESLNLKSVALSGNSATYGGAVFVDGQAGAASVTISNSLITKNTASDFGGGLDLARLTRSIAISSSTLSGNTVANSGGGAAYLSIGSAGAGISITKTAITGNSAGYGGGLLTENFSTLPTAKTNISGCTISGNSSTSTSGRGGGGVYLTLGICSITSSTISSNSSVYNGGGIEVNGFASLTISKSTVSGNRTSATNANGQGGGGVFIADTGSGTLKPATITGCTIALNTSAKYGGGVFATNRVNLTVTGSTFTGNSGDSGGGVMCFGSTLNRADLNISGSTFSNNSAVFGGGGIACRGDGQLSITASKVTGNTSGIFGGGIFVQSYYGANAVAIKNVVVSGNSANLGGGIQISDSSGFKITGGSISNNTGLKGGGVRIFNSSGSIQGTTVSGNTATITGGGAYFAGSGAVAVQAARVKTNTAPLNADFDGSFTFT